MKKLLLILNPIAGTKKAPKNLTEIIGLFNRSEFDVRVYVTACQEDVKKAIKLFGKKADLIVCCGGDGTMNETISGLIENGLTTPIGYIPAGSTNDFASSLHLSTDVVKAAKQIVEGTPHAYDIGKFNDKYFCYVASFGLFTKTSYNTPQNIKNAFGHVAYLLGGVQELSNIRKEHIRMEIDGEVIEDDYLFGAICNSVSVGGVLTLSPDIVDMADGKFEILLIKAPKDLQELGECIFALTNQKYDSKMIPLYSGSRIKIQASADMDWSLDGEKQDGVEEIEIENLHKHINLVH